MKTYTINYTAVTEADALLQRAIFLLANDAPHAARVRIGEARQLLQQYTNDGALIECDDVEDPLVRLHDIQPCDR